MRPDLEFRATCIREGSALVVENVISGMGVTSVFERGFSGGVPVAIQDTLARVLWAKSLVWTSDDIVGLLKVEIDGVLVPLMGLFGGERDEGKSFGVPLGKHHSVALMNHPLLRKGSVVRATFEGTVGGTVSCCIVADEASPEAVEKMRAAGLLPLGASK